MKRLYFISIFLLTTFGFLHSQEASTDLMIDGKMLTITVKKLTNSYQYSYKQGNNSSTPSYTANSLNMEFLKAYTKDAYNEINKTISTKAKKDIDGEIYNKFIELFSILINDDAEGPEIAKITLKEKIPVYTSTESDSPPTHFLTPENGYFVFKDGFIEQVVIYGVVKSESEASRVSVTTGIASPIGNKRKGINSSIFVDNKKYGFTNFYAIGISSVPNIQNIINVRLFVTESKKNGFIKLGEAIDYERKPQFGTRDYSPENGEIELVKGQTIKLHKPSNKDILQFKVYSDIVGIGEENPNGLVQLELNKKIPITTYRYKLWPYKRVGWSIFTFISFDFAWTKIENKVKYLELSSLFQGDNADSSASYYLDALQVYRYQIFQIGSKLNLLLIESQPLKFDFEINWHANFGYARLIDTIVVNNESLSIDQPLNSILTGPEIKFIFFPEKRINISISDKITRQYFLFGDVNYEYASFDPRDGSKNEASKCFNTIGIDAYYWPSDRGKLFVRYRLNHELNNIYSNFSQFQIGYSMTIRTSIKE